MVSLPLDLPAPPPPLRGRLATPLGKSRAYARRGQQMLKYHVQACAAGCWTRAARDYDSMRVVRGA